MRCIAVSQRHLLDPTHQQKLTDSTPQIESLTFFSFHPSPFLPFLSFQKPSQSTIVAVSRTVKPAESSNITRAHLHSSAKPLTILVVDDSETSRKMTIKLLTKCGHHCHEAGNGHDALYTISGICEGNCCNRGSVKVSVDAVLMDHHMPLMSGNSNSTLPRQTHPPFPLIVHDCRDLTFTSPQLVLVPKCPLPLNLKSSRLHQLYPSSSPLLLPSPIRPGPEATKKMRDAGYKGLIIGMSGDDSSNSFMLNGADNFLLKPVCWEELRNALIPQTTKINTTTPSTEGNDEV